MAIGVILYLLLLALSIMFWQKLRGMSFDDVLTEIDRVHHHVHKVIAEHPQGGTWQKHQQWLAE